MRQVQKNTFGGGMDTDSSPFFVSNTDYARADNLLNSIEGGIGTLTSVKGTLEVPLGLPLNLTGDGKVVAMVEDKQRLTMLIFFWNENGGHRLIRWNAQSNSSELLLQGSSLELMKNAIIHSADVIDGRYLSWVQGVHDPDLSFAGGTPCFLDLDRLSTQNKQRTYEIYAGLPGQPTYLSGTIYNIRVLENNATLENVNITALGGVSGDPSAILSLLKVQIENSVIGNYVSIEECGCKLNVTMNNTGQYLEFSSNAEKQDIVLAHINSFPVAINTNRFFFEAGKRPAACAPEVNYVHSDALNGNSVSDLCAAFRVRYVYRDSQSSAWSPISLVPINVGFDGVKKADQNAIKIDFSDARMNDTNWLSLIEKVEIAFRPTPTDPFRLITSLDVCEIGTCGQQFFVFDNIAAYPLVASDDPLAVSDPSVQVLRNNDEMPQIAMTQGLMSDSEGNVRLYYGGTGEGYDLPDCVEADLEPFAVDKDCLVRIYGVISALADHSIPELYPPTPYLAGSDLVGKITGILSATQWTFEITDVPRGIYSLRLSTGLVTLNSSIDEYNSNSRKIRRTSAPIIDFAGSPFSGEKVIDLRAATTDSFDAGEVIVATVSDVERFLEVYVLDNNGNADTAAARYASDAVERITVSFFYVIAGVPDPTPFATKVTDHAGYAWCEPDLNVSPIVRVVVNGMSDRVVYDGGVFGWEAVSRDLATIVPNGDINIAASEIHSAFVFNTEPDWTTENSRIVTGQVAYGAGLPLSGAKVWSTRQGREAEISGLSSYRIKFYRTNGSLGSTRNETVYANYPPDWCYDYPFTPPSILVIIADFTTQDLFDVGLMASSLPSLSLLEPSRYLKAGGLYRVGLVYEDDMNRSSGVLPLGDVSIPFLTEPLGYDPRKLRVKLSHLPPAWATKYRIGLSRESYYRSYFQTVVPEVRYVNINALGTVASNSTYGSATHILLKLNLNVAQDATTNPLLLMFNPNRAGGYKVSAGDRVRIMLRKGNNALSSILPIVGNRIIEAPVEGEFFDTGSYFIVVPAANIAVELQNHDFVEVFTPANNANETTLFFETGDCYPIAGGYHLANELDQTAGNAAQVVVRYGDTWWRRDTFSLPIAPSGSQNYGVLLEHQTMRASDKSPCYDGGRGFVQDEFASKRTFHFNRIRFSGVYVPGSNVNNLNVFGSLDYRNMNRQFGPVCRLVPVGNVLVAVCANKVQPIYVGAGEVLSIDGSATLTANQSILNFGQESISDFGSRNPESIVADGGSLYAWDAARGAVWRYSQNGVQDIGVGMKKFFLNMRKTRSVIAGGFLDTDYRDIVLGAIDRQNDCFLLSFTESAYVSDDTPVTIPASTLVFSQPMQRWQSFLSFYPDCMGAVANFLMSGKWIDEFSGILWKNNEGGYANFFGDEYSPSVVFYANAGRDAVKDWWSLRLNVIAGRSKNPVGSVECPSIVAPVAEGYPTGMASLLKADRFLKQEGQLVADFLRDKNDPTERFDAKYPIFAEREVAKLYNARRLKGKYLAITVKGLSEYLQLISADTYFTLSSITNE